MKPVGCKKLVPLRNHLEQLLEQTFSGANWTSVRLSQSVRLAAFKLTETEENEDLLLEIFSTLAKVCLT